MKKQRNTSELTVQEVERLAWEQRYIGPRINICSFTLVLVIPAWIIFAILAEFPHDFFVIPSAFMIGYTVRYYGNSLSLLYGIFAGLLTITAIFFVNYIISFVYFDQYSMPNITYPPKTFIETLAFVANRWSPIDYLLYVIGIVTSYKLGFQKVTKDNIKEIIAELDLEKENRSQL